jgi:MFS family permease
MLLAVPYGIIADHRSRRFVMMLGLLGALLAETWIGLVLWLWNIFPVNTIFVFPVFLCIGGGGPVLSAVLLTVIADVTPIQYL